MSKIHEGYLLIADITGYTRYLSDSELEHAQDTLTALLELLVENTRSPLVISRLAGDAVISYGLRENFFLGQTFIEKIEGTYAAFRKALERLVLNNTCRCNACANISNLDLKFFVHYGTFGIQHISDHDELVGSDINLLHRLLKNSVTEKMGLGAYALYTESAIQQLNVEDLVEGMTLHSETYEHVGKVKVFVQDMHPVWERMRSASAIDFPANRLLDQSVVHINLPPERVWDFIIQPQYRNTLIGSDRMEITNRSSGRIAPNSVYQCYHGDKVIPQTILEWQPFERMITREVPAILPSLRVLVEYRLDPVDGGTKLTKSVAEMTGPLLHRIVLLVMSPFFSRFGIRMMEQFAREIEQVARAQGEVQNDIASITETEIRHAAAASLNLIGDAQEWP